MSRFDDINYSYLNQNPDYDKPVQIIQVQEIQEKLDSSEIQKIIEESVKNPQGFDIINEQTNEKIQETLNPEKNIKQNIPERLKILTKKAQTEEDKKYFSWKNLSLDDVLNGFGNTMILLFKKGINFFDYFPNDKENTRFVYLGIIVILISLILLL